MKPKKAGFPSCASCTSDIPEKVCFTSEGRGYKGCPTVTRKELLAEANKKYEKEDTKTFAHTASRQEAECYRNRDQKPYIMQPSKTRLVETCEFAEKMGYSRIGLAFCIGLSMEAKIVEDIISGYGFEVISVCCKAGNTSKDIIGISDDDKVYKGTDEAMCNPIFQAEVLTNENVEFNVLLGLCVGHDSLFFKNTDIPTTVLAVKDRVTGHNPLAAVYHSTSYYKKIRYPGSTE